MKRIVVAVLLCSSLAVAGDKNSADWKTGKLLSFGREHWTSHSGSTTNGQVDPYGNVHASTQDDSWGHVTFYAAVDDGEFTYFAERTLSFRWQHEPVLTENADIKWKLETDNFTILDERGKEFKMKLDKKRKDDAPAQQTPASPVSSK